MSQVSIDSIPCKLEAVEALVGVGKEASAWLVQNLNGNIPQGMSTPVTIQMMPSELQFLGCPCKWKDIGATTFFSAANHLNLSSQA